MRVISQLRHGDVIPAGVPRRYRTSAGYIKLRWPVGGGCYVEAYEHRVICGLPDAHVHHRNGIRSDNRIDNLAILTPRLHQAEHRGFDYAKAAEMYEAGFTTAQVGTAFGVSPSQMSRALRSVGVEMRHGVLTDAPEDCICVMHMGGRRAPSIALEVGVSTPVVRRVIKNLGLPPHRPGRPPQGPRA